MWQFHKERIDADIERWQLLARNDTALSFAQVFEYWRVDEGFRMAWQSSLRQSPFESFCWESPPVTARDSAQPFECVLVSSPLLAGAQADPDPFAEYFRPGCGAVTFESLGQDALLVAPCPGGQGSNFAQLASFVATASEAHASALWKAVGDALKQRIGARPTWLSTAGLGVSWLHVRLDTHPKYYRHAPYRRGA